MTHTEGITGGGGVAGVAGVVVSSGGRVGRPEKTKKLKTCWIKTQVNGL